MQPAAILNVLVNAQTGKASTELRRFDRQVRSTGSSTKRAMANVDRMNPALAQLGSSANRASRSMRRLVPELNFATRVPVYKIAGIAAAIQAVIPPVVALTSALAPLTGLLAALPGLASAAAQGIGTLALGFKGIGDAVGAALDAQKTAVKDTASALKSNRAAAENVRSAVRAVGDAERSLADSQRDARDAQQDLSAARRDAARELVDMRLAVSGAALSEKEARLELTRAIQEQTDVWADEQATALDAREAELAVQRARLGLREATVGSKRAQDDYNDAQKKGVRGSEQVVSAQRALGDAQRGVADAQRGLLEATRQVRIAQREQAEGAASAAGGVDKLRTAMEQLPAAGRNFARFIISLKPRLDELREAAASGIFPGLTRGIRAAMTNFGAIRGAIASTATALGELGEQAGRRLGSAEWGRDIQVQGERNVETIGRLGRATLELADGFRHIMLAAGPLVSFLTTSAERFASVFASWAEGARASGQLDAFFQRTIKTTKLVVEAFWDFGRALINVGKIADRVWGQDLLRGINNVAERFRDWTESVRGQRAIEGYFERWRRRWGEIADAVGDVIGEYTRLRRAGKSMAEAFTTVFADVLAKAIPATANKLAEQAPKIVGAFVRGFLNADAWGKLLVGGWLIAKFGGVGAFALIGRKLGAALGLGIGSGAAAAAAGGAGGGAATGGLLGALRGKLLPVAKRVGLAGVGIALADSLLSEFSRRSAQRGPDMFKALKAAQGSQEIAGINLRESVPIPFKVIGDLTGEGERIEKAKKLEQALRGIADASSKISPDRAKELRRQIAGLEELSPGVRAAMNNLVGNAEDNFFRLVRATNAVKRSISLMRDGLVFNVKDMRQAVSSNFERIANDIGVDTDRGRRLLDKNFDAGLKTIRRFVREGKISTEQGMKEIARMMELQSGKGAAGVRQNMDEVRDVIARTMRRGGKITAEGLGFIKDLFVKELRLYGLSPRQALAGANVRTGEVPGGRRRQDFQRGGPINMGAPSGDTVPAMLERGEYVLNRRAVAKAGKQNLDALNFASAPRFQAGGIAGMVSAANRVDKAQFPYLWGGGHQATPAPFGPFDCSGAVSYVLQHGGVQIPTMVSGALASAGRPGPGTVTVFANPTHTFMRIGSRYFGTSGSNPGGGAGWFPDPGESYKSGFVQRHFKGKGALGKIARVMVEGRDSALKSAVQAGLDTTRRGANKRLSSAALIPIGSGDSGDPGPFGDVMASGRGRGETRAHGLLRGGLVGLQKGGHVGSRLLRGLDKVFPAHYLGQPGRQLSSDQVRAVAEAWGGLSPARALQADQITLGESSRHPGIIGQDPGGTLGIGLWQITRGVQGALGKSWIDRRGGDTGMRNPRKNAEVMSIMSGKGSSWSNWFGTRYLQPLQQNVRSVFGAAGPGGADGEAKPKQKPKEQPFRKPPFGGPLGRVLNKTLKSLRTHPSAKLRAGRLAQFMKRVRRAGTVPEGLTNQLGLLSIAADIAGTNADRAGSLNVDNEDGTTTLTPFLGKDQGGWLNEQLGHLLGWRNKVIDAITLLQERRERLRKLLEDARERLERIKDTIKKVADDQEKRRKQLDELRKHPKQNKTKISALRGLIMKIDDQQKGRARERKGLAQLIPGIRSQVVTLGGEDGLGGFQTTLTGLQGPGGSLAKMTSAPPISQIGGTIFDTLLNLRDLATSATARGTDSPVTDSESIELLKQLLREANLRTAVSERQFQIFKDFDATSGAGQFMGAFAKGGVALVGEQGPELAHLPSGTRIHSASDTASMVQPDVSVVIWGDVVNVPRGKDPVEARIDGRRVRVSNRAPLPGAGGGGF